MPSKKKVCVSEVTRGAYCRAHGLAKSSKSRTGKVRNPDKLSPFQRLAYDLMMARRPLDELPPEEIRRVIEDACNLACDITPDNYQAMLVSFLDRDIRREEPETRYMYAVYQSPSRGGAL